MLEEIEKYLGVLSHYYALISLIVGGIVGYTLTVMLERYFMPIATDPQTKRRQKGITFLFCWATSSISSCLMWWSLEPEDKHSAILAISFCVSVLSFVLYPIVVRYMMTHYPEIGSAWKREEE